MIRPAAALLAALLAAAAVAQPVPMRSDRALRTDPKAKAAAPAFAGVWLATQPTPNGDVTRYHEMRVLDADTAVWTFTQVAPGVRVSSTLRGRYEIAGGEFRLHVAERYYGEELMPVRPEDKKGPRAYRFAWDADKVGFSLTAPDAAADSPWRVTAFRRGAPAVAAPDPLVPKALLTIDRAIKKEPRYGGTPLYVLFAFGPDSTRTMWAVLDGQTLYLDKNGDGDLTEDGERVLPFLIPGEAPNPRAAFFHLPALDAAGGKHTDFIFSVIRNPPTDGVYVKTGLKVDGKTTQLAGPTDLRLTESPAEARVLPFGSRVVTAQVSHTMPGTPEAGKAVDFRVRVGTPGVGAGSFVAFGSEDVAADPLAEFEFPAARPGDAARRVTLPLTERCCGDQFYAALRVPDGSRTGLDAAALTLSFPNCPWGPVAPTTRRVDVMPRQP